MVQPRLTPPRESSILAPDRLIESLLFVAGEPVAVRQLAAVLELSEEVVGAAIDELARACAERGVRLQRHGDHVQLVSAPEAAAVIRRFLGLQSAARLSIAALEVLAIIAYRQPVTRAQVEAIRGVDSSSIIRSLLTRELIVEAGRLESVGRPILYATTATFLQQFGLGSLQDLPMTDMLETVDAVKHPAIRG
jgi:segregation and condensation protein B